MRQKGILMALSIKSDEASKLARELSDLTGETLTTAVTVALQERVERLRRERRADELKAWLRALSKETGPLFKEPYRSIDHGDLLYDERGLPREGPLLDFERRPLR
jgi:antitoxin VapB